MSPRSGNGTPSGGTGDDRIAIVGVGCRFPGGVRTLDSFGRLLSAGGHVFTEVPRERWGPERSAGRRRPHIQRRRRLPRRHRPVRRLLLRGLAPGGERDGSQQRLLLEVAWEAMSDSGRPAGAWTGTRTGAFFGMFAHDYATLHTKTLGMRGIGPHDASGNESSFVAGRLAYTYDLAAPSPSPPPAPPPCSPCIWRARACGPARATSPSPAGSAC